MWKPAEKPRKKRSRHHLNKNIMASVKGTCRKCGKTYGHYANTQSARHNVSSRTCKNGGKCEADV